MAISGVRPIKSGLRPLPDFSTLMPVFTQQTQNITERQTLETEVTQRNLALEDQAVRESRTVADMARQAAELNRQRQMEILSGIEKEVSKASTAIRLSDSKNPLDRMNLYMLQQTDDSYTRDGNLRRIEYYNQAAAAVNGVGLVEQQGYQSQLQGIQSDLDVAKMEDSGELTLLKLREAQGQEQIQLANDYMTTLTANIANTATVRDTVLSQTPDAALPGAIQQAQANPNGTANIQGVEIPLALLESRQAAIADRNFLLHSRGLIMVDSTLATMTAQDIATALPLAQASGTFVKDGVAIPLARLQERQAALSNQSYNQFIQAQTVTQTMDANLREANKRALSTYSATELGQMVANGGFDHQRGVQYNLEDVRSTFETVRAGVQQASALDMLIQQGALTAQPAADHANFLGSLKTTPGTMLEQLVQQQTQFTRVSAATLGNAAIDDYAKVDSYQFLQTSRDVVDKAIKEQALMDAGGDKDLAILHEARIRNTPVAPEVLETMIIERGQNPKKSLAGILTPDMNAEFIRVFNATKEQLAAEGLTSGLGSMSQTDMNAMAAGKALEAIKQKATNGITETMLGFQSFITGHPLQNKLQPAALLTLINGAEARAEEAYVRAGMTPEALAAHKSGVAIDNELLRRQQGQVILDLNKQEPGLGDAYVKWWTSTSPNSMMTRFAQGQTATKNTTQEVAEWSLVAPQLQSMASDYGAILFEGQKSLHEQELIRQHREFVTFRGDAGAKQAFLIQRTPGLTDTDKQLAYTMLQPLINETKANKMNAEQAATYIEGKLRTMQAQPGDQQRVLKLLLAGRGDALQTLDDFAIASDMSDRSNPFLPPAIKDAVLGDPVQRNVNTFPWLQQLSK